MLWGFHYCLILLRKPEWTKPIKNMSFWRKNSISWLRRLQCVKKSKLNCFLRNRIGTTVICFPLGVVVNNQMLPCSSTQQAKISLHVVITLQHPIARSPAGIICKQVQYKQKDSSCFKIADFLLWSSSSFLWWGMFLLF